MYKRSNAQFEGATNICNKDISTIRAICVLLLSKRASSPDYPVSLRCQCARPRNLAVQRLGILPAWPSLRIPLFRPGFRMHNRGNWCLGKQSAGQRALLLYMSYSPDLCTSALTRMFTPPIPSSSTSSSLLFRQSPRVTRYFRLVLYSLYPNANISVYLSCLTTALECMPSARTTSLSKESASLRPVSDSIHEL